MTATVCLGMHVLCQFRLAQTPTWIKKLASATHLYTELQTGKELFKLVKSRSSPELIPPQAGRNVPLVKAAPAPDRVGGDGDESRS